MTYWISMFLVNNLIPLSMLLGGLYMWKLAPNRFSKFIGYRSTRSMLNQTTWDFANIDCGRRWTIVGALMAPIVALVQIPFIHSNDDVISFVTVCICAVAIAVMLFTIPITEKKLKEKFDDNGQLR